MLQECDNRILLLNIDFLGILILLVLFTKNFNLFQQVSEIIKVQAKNFALSRFLI